MFSARRPSLRIRRSVPIHPTLPRSLPSVESLEDRTLPCGSTWGAGWAHALAAPPIASSCHVHVMPEAAADTAKAMLSSDALKGG